VGGFFYWIPPGTVLGDGPFGNGWVPYCSGSLIHPRVVLFAAHCVVPQTSTQWSETVPPIEYAIQQGAEYYWTFDHDALPLDTVDKVKIDRIIVHPKYAPSQWPVELPGLGWASVDWDTLLWSTGGIPQPAPPDVALAILEEPVTSTFPDVEPVTLAPMGLIDDLLAAGDLVEGTPTRYYDPIVGSDLVLTEKDGSLLTVVGYGYCAAWWWQPDPGYTDYLDYPDCNFYPGFGGWTGTRRHVQTPFWNLIGESAPLHVEGLYIRTDGGMTDTEGNVLLGIGGIDGGDSGGPILWTDEDGHVYLIGVNHLTHSRRDYHVRVDVPATRDFIDGVLSAVDDMENPERFQRLGHQILLPDY